MRVLRCPGCDGQRLNPQARAVRVGGQIAVFFVLVVAAAEVVVIAPAENQSAVARSMRGASIM